MQKDLFGASTVSPLMSSMEPKSDFLQRFRLQLRLDQTIIGALLLLVVYVLVFSFGVESGKRYAMAEIKAERSMRERMARELGEKIFANSQSQLAAATTAPGAPTASVQAKVSTPAAPTVQATAPVTSPETAPEIKTGSGKFLVQTVTYTTKAAAEEQIKLLAKKGYAGKILPRGKFQQVCVGGFETRDKATQAMSQLKTQGLAPQDAYIRTLA